MTFYLFVFTLGVVWPRKKTRTSFNDWRKVPSQRFQSTFIQSFINTVSSTLFPVLLQLSRLEKIFSHCFMIKNYIWNQFSTVSHKGQHNGDCDFWHIKPQWSLICFTDLRNLISLLFSKLYNALDELDTPCLYFSCRFCVSIFLLT